MSRAAAGGPFGGHGTLGDVAVYYKLNEESGVRADEVASRDLTDNNTVLYTSSGKDGNASLHVRANSEYLTVTDDVFKATDDFSMCGWFYNTTNTANQGLLHKDAIAGGTRDYGFYYPGATTITGYGFAPGFLSFTITAAWSQDAWHFLAFWYDHSAQTIYGSMDDGAVANKALGADLVVTASAFSIGAFSNGGNAYDGRVDAVGFWSRVLTSGEITDLAAGLYY